MIVPYSFPHYARPQRGMTYAVSEYCLTLQNVQYILIFWMSGKVAVDLVQVDLVQIDG